MRARMLDGNIRANRDAVLEAASKLELRNGRAVNAGQPIDCKPTTNHQSSETKEMQSVLHSAGRRATGVFSMLPPDCWVNLARES